VKGSGADACAEGPFLQWQTCSGEVAKVPRERTDTSPPPLPSRKAGGAKQQQL